MAPLAWLTARPIAHRGLHDANSGRHENSASAFEAAARKGFAIECDVQISADGEAMVFHDFVLDRMTEATGRCDAQSAAALSRLTLAGGPDRVEPLGALLTRVAGRVPLVVEIKSGFSGDPRLARRAAEVAADYAGPLAFKSFDPAILIALAAAAPAVPRGIVAMNQYEPAHFPGLSERERHALANLLHFTQTRPDFLSWHVHDLPCAAPYLCRSMLGLPVMTWTVRSAADAAHARTHADQIVFEGFDPST